jgi:hypothetical protein
MPDDPYKKGGPDRDRINVGESYEAIYWAEELRVNEARLKDLVAENGPIVKERQKGSRQDIISPAASPSATGMVEWTGAHLRMSAGLRSF